MTIPVPAGDHVETLALSVREQRLVKALRLLQQVAPAAPDEVEQFLWSLVGKHLKWSYSDPESLRRAEQFAALDPFLRREVEAITAEFACAEGDGLEDY